MPVPSSLRFFQFSKGKTKLICQQTNKISQQPENWKNRNELGTGISEEMEG
jgi:hypothetical protein